MDLFNSLKYKMKNSIDSMMSIIAWGDTVIFLSGRSWPKLFFICQRERLRIFFSNFFQSCKDNGDLKYENPGFIESFIVY